jgi:hypothetical protein
MSVREFSTKDLMKAGALLREKMPTSIGVRLREAQAEELRLALSARDGDATRRQEACGRTDGVAAVGSDRRGKP